MTNSVSENYNEIGFLVSSSILLLAKGEQKVVLKFYLTTNSFEKAKGLVDDLIDQETQESKDWKKPETQILTKISSDAFTLFITDNVGWKQLECFKVHINSENQALSFTIELNQGYDNFVSFDKEIHSGNFESNYPCIKILLNNHAKVYPYKFLRQLIVKSIFIEAAVSGVTELCLSNSIGGLDSSIPFTPFGPAPYPGGYLRIENPLIVQKNLTSLTLNLEWSGLPIDSDGFKDYYKEYNNDIENSSFKAVLSTSRIVDDTHYQDSDEAFELFDCEDNSERLINLKRKEVNLEKLYLNNRIDPLRNTNTEGNTPLYLILVQPRMAFGHHLFSNIFAETALKKSRFRKRHLPLPKQPYTPILGQLRVDYTNKAMERMISKKDDPSDINFMHLNPYGYVQVFPSPTNSACFLLPQIKNNGNLLIGLNNIQAADLGSAGFDLSSVEYATKAIIKKPEIKWEYLNNNKWIYINRILMQDPTDSITKSGLENLSIKSDFI
jgi:hypothetical protein